MPLWVLIDLVSIWRLSATSLKLVLQEFWFKTKQSVLNTCNNMILVMINMKVMETIKYIKYCLHARLFELLFFLVSLLP